MDSKKLMCIVGFLAGLAGAAAPCPATEISAPLEARDPIYRELRWADDLGLLADPLPGHRPLSRKAVFDLLGPSRGEHGPSRVSGPMQARIAAARRGLVPWDLFWDKGLYPVTVGGGALQRLTLVGSSLTAGRDAPEPWNLGETYRDGVRVLGEGSFFLEGDWLALNYGYRMSAGGHAPVTFRTTAWEARTGWRNLRLSVGRTPVWWSPSDQSALLLSTNARPLDQVRLETDGPWRTPLGSFHAGFFVAHLDDPGRKDYPDPWLSGLRAVWWPASWFTFGATRTVMLGGQGNPYALTFDSFWDLLTWSNENRRDPEDRANDANHIVSVEASLYLWPLFRHVPVLQGGRVYAERGGEDSPQQKHFNAVLPSAPGLTIGLELIAAGVFFRGEASDNVDDSNIWYYHRRYTDGYTLRDRVLGHAMGGDARAYSLDMEAPVRGGRDLLRAGWRQWDRGHEAAFAAPPADPEASTGRGILDHIYLGYEFALGKYPGSVALEGRTRNFRGDTERLGNQEEWGITLSWRR